MKKLIHFLSLKIKHILLIYVVIQLILIFFTDINYRSDALYYYKLADECIKLNEFYPAEKHLFEDYLVAPLYINMLIILLKINNSTIVISLFNLLLILTTIFFMFKISSKIFTDNTARLTIIIFMLYLNTVGLVLQNYTELFFTLLIVSSIYFSQINKKFSLFVSGILLGSAIAVRPLGWALLLSFITIQLLVSIKTKKIIFNYFLIYAGTLVIILSFGLFTYSHFGKFEYTATTGPVNLLIGANDNATGGFNSIIYEKGKAGYLENPRSLTYLEKGEFYREQALEWIKENPFRWLLLAPMKFIHSYGWDDVSLSSLLGQDVYFLKVVKTVFVEGNFDNALPDTSFAEKVLYFTILISSHFFYYILLTAIALGIFYLFKQKLLSDPMKLIILFALFSTLMIMIVVGTPRYKYPAFILFLPFAANYIRLKIESGKTTNE
jgi:hypothetical protein